MSYQCANYWFAATAKRAREKNSELFGSFSKMSDPPPPSPQKIWFILHFRSQEAFLVFTKMFTFCQYSDIYIRAGPQNEKWSNRQNTSDPTGSIHKKAGKKSLTQKNLILIGGLHLKKMACVAWKMGPKYKKHCQRHNGPRVLSL